MNRGILAGVIAVAVVGVVAAGLLMRGQSPVSEAGYNEQVAPDGDLDVTLQMEAEDFQAEAPMEIGTAGDASGGKFLTIPEGPNKQELNPPYCSKDGIPITSKDGQLVWCSGKDDGRPIGNDVPLYPNGLAWQTFTIDQPGEHVLWARHYWPHSCADSFRYWIGKREQFDSLRNAGKPIPQNEQRVFTGGTTKKVWSWSRPNLVDPPLQLQKGEYVLVIMNREDGMRVDKFLLTNITDDWVPIGLEGE